MNNTTLLIRDSIKHAARFIEQIYYRIFTVEREAKTSIALNARLDIGKKLSLKRQPLFHKLRLGESSLIESFAIINTYHGEVNMGDNARLGIGSIIIGPVCIGNNTGISQYCFITGENRKHSNNLSGLVNAIDGVTYSPVKIGSGCWIGAGVTILPGVEIGDCCTIAAGAVVTKSIPAYSLAAGVPAKVIKYADIRELE